MLEGGLRGKFKDAAMENVQNAARSSKTTLKYNRAEGLLTELIESYRELQHWRVRPLSIVVVSSCSAWHVQNGHVRASLFSTVRKKIFRLLVAFFQYYIVIY